MSTKSAIQHTLMKFKIVLLLTKCVLDRNSDRGGVLYFELQKLVTLTTQRRADLQICIWDPHRYSSVKWIVKRTIKCSLATSRIHMWKHLSKFNFNHWRLTLLKSSFVQWQSIFSTIKLRANCANFIIFIGLLLTEKRRSF